MSDRAKKISELSNTSSVANGDFFIIEKVATNTTSKITGNNLAKFITDKFSSNGTFTSMMYGTSNVYINGSAGNVVISAAANAWTFDTNGVLRGPGNTLKIANTITTPAGQYYLATSDTSVEMNWTTATVTNNNPYYSKFNSNASGAYIITAKANNTGQANDKTWTFGMDGVFTFPGSIVGNSFSVNSTALLVGNSTTNSVFGFNATNQTMAEFAGNANGFNYVLIRNANSGTESSADIALYNNSWETTADKFIDMGILSSAWSNAAWTIGGSSDGYIYTGNSNITIGTIAQNSVIFFSNGSLNTNERMRITPGGNVGIGNTTPNAKLQVTGTANISGDVTITGAATLSNTLASGNVTITGFANVSTTLAVTGAATLSSTLASGNVTVTGFANVSTTLDVTGAATFSNTVNAAAINITGQVNTATLYITTSANVGTYFTVNSSSASKTVNSSFSGANLNVTTTNTYITSNTTIAGTITTISSNLSVTGTVSSNLTLSGLLSSPLSTKVSNDTGTAGQISWDTNYIYVCTATNTWKRVLLETY